MPLNYTYNSSPFDNDFAEFYLFDVNHGQCSALRLPNNEWCVFDFGHSSLFSPVYWMLSQKEKTTSQILKQYDQYYLRFEKITLSHFHGDHFGDFENIFLVGSKIINTVPFDSQYLSDSRKCCSNVLSENKLNDFIRQLSTLCTPISLSYADQPTNPIISEQCIPVSIARTLNSSVNSKVNNASVISRLEYNGTKILICGDMEKEGWDFIIDYPSVFASWNHLIKDIDILVAPHHGHKSGFSKKMLEIAKPKVVLVSVNSKDPHVDTRYSGSLVKGITLNGVLHKSFTTRKNGHMKVTLNKNGNRTWTFGNDSLR